MPDPQLLSRYAARPAENSALSNEIEVLSMEESRRCGITELSRHDYFKVALITNGTNELQYATRSFTIDRPALVFTNRMVPYVWEELTESGGYVCGFSEAFLQSAMRGVSLPDSVLYRVDGNPVYFLDEKQLPYLTEAFGRMLRAISTDYPHKHDLLRNQLSLIIHEAAQMQPASAHQGPPANAAERITNLFMALLEGQFPVTTQLQKPILKSAQDYATQLSVHVNHLNRSVKEVTGKSTTAHIAERLVSETKLLLQYTDWSVADIAYSLGFEYANYFANFFKKYTSITPLAFRKAL